MLVGRYLRKIGIVVYICVILHFEHCITSSRYYVTEIGEKKTSFIVFVSADRHNRELEICWRYSIVVRFSPI